VPAIFAAVTALLAALLIGRTWGVLSTLQHGKHCPMCGRRAFPLAHRTLARLLGRFVQRRWCPACGWEGLRRRRHRVPVSGEVDRASGFRWAAPPAEDRPLLWNDRDKNRDDSTR
jgi:hypothetical protein